MTVAVMKSKAELGFVEAFPRVAGHLPGTADVTRLRESALQKFDELGLPHRRIEEFKYTDLRAQIGEALPVAAQSERVVTIADVLVALGPLAHVEAGRVVFVDGRYREDLSSASDLSGVAVVPLAEVLDKGAAVETYLGNRLKRDDAVLELNTAYAMDGAVVRIGEGQDLEKPLMLVHMRTSANPGFTANRHLVTVAANAKAAIVEAFVKLPGASEDAQTNAATEISIDAGGDVHHVKLMADKGAATHLGHVIASVGREASYRLFQQTQGVKLARNDINVVFTGEDAKLDISGAFLGQGRDHTDTTLVVEHVLPGCESRELFKGVLADRSRGVFQGKIIVQPEAQKTDGKQMAQALMLSEDAEFDSKPELEIYADDVACGHGSTVAEIEEDLLFYCRARGIPVEEAKVLLTESFVAEAIEQVEIEDVQDALMAFARDWLAEVAARPVTS